jgi:hypothetical protein
MSAAYGESEAAKGPSPGRGVVLRALASPGYEVTTRDLYVPQRPYREYASKRHRNNIP